jgi:type IV secretory pathway VirB10-like protein
VPACAALARLVPRREVGRRGLGRAVLSLVALAVLVSGCSTAQIDSIPQAIGGLPAGAPARPAQAPDFPAVHDMPPPRPAVLDAEQQKRLEADLIAVRNRQPNQQKNIAREKAKAEKAAKAKAAQENKAKSGRGKKKSPKSSGEVAGQPASQGAATDQAPAGTPPWPLPPQTTGGSPRP